MSSDMTYDTGISIPDVLRNGPVTAEVLGAILRLSFRLKSQDRTAIAKALGVTLPAKIGASTQKNDLMSACLGPDEWILIGDPIKNAKLYNKAVKLSSKYVMSVTDISHRNVAIRVSGAGAADMINVGCPLDLRLSAFPVGKCTRSVFENSPVLIYRSAEDSFVVECWRSYAPYVLGLMTAHATSNQNG